MSLATPWVPHHDGGLGPNTPLDPTAGMHSPPDFNVSVYPPRLTGNR
jgi:hypothetical protein